MKTTKSPDHPELQPEDLRWHCSPSVFSFKTTEELEPGEKIIGQERALEALKLGVNINSPGYNIFIAGLSGTGKATTVKKLLESMSEKEHPLYDYAYVFNFTEPDKPLLLTFPAGKAKVFQSELQNLISFLRKNIPRVLESNSYLEKRKRIYSEFNEREKQYREEYEKEIRGEGFTLGQIEIEGQVRPDIMPLINGEAIPVFELENLVKEKKLLEKNAEALIEKYKDMQSGLMQLIKKGMQLNQELQARLRDLEKEEVASLVSGSMAAYYERYSDKKIINYLSHVKGHILDNLQLFKSQGDTEQIPPHQNPFKAYHVNVILDNSRTKGRPVLVEISPTHTNLFGTIEKVPDGKGGWTTDFTNIKGGSLLQANGGFLVLNAVHVFEAATWKTLKRVLTFRKLDIQDNYVQYQLIPSILKPEAIPIDTKVILIGNSYIYSMLASHEDDFKKVFKIKADFDYEVETSNELMREYSRVIKKMVKQEGMLDIDKKGMAYLMELAARTAGRKDKLTTRFSILVDLVREADFWARDTGDECVGAKHVKRAYEAARHRHSMWDEKTSEFILDNTVMISTSGEEVGQVNGLAYFGSDIFGFGKPVKITAAVALGNGAIVNVEREAGYSGKSYDKAMLIISGYFRQVFGQRHPLSFNAGIVFEQSYTMIDGDSASTAEVCVLLSALSEVPIKQSLAITGSVNQRGLVQAIGGVNEKIEGFFEICSKRGLDGTHGVIIPKQNVRDLMLGEKVITAVNQGKFHIYPAATVTDAIEILTGVSAGHQVKSGLYGKTTIFGIVQRKLEEMYKRIKPRPVRAQRKPATKQTNQKEDS